MPQTLKPFLYELQLKLYIGTNETYGEKSFTTDGFAKIHFTCVIPTKKILFHAEDLNINETSIELISSDIDEQQIFTNKIPEYNFEKNFVLLNLNQECKRNSNYTLQMAYTGLILPYTYGLYRSSYVDKNGNLF